MLGPDFTVTQDPMGLPGEAAEHLAAARPATIHLAALLVRA
jgi:hypothetical protein